MQIRRFSPPTRWCPRCDTKGVPILHGYPSPDMARLASEGQVLLGGCLVYDDMPSHGCLSCGAAFFGQDRRYLDDTSPVPVRGVAVWPHGRRATRVELTTDGVIVLDPSGSMIIPARGVEKILTQTWQSEGPEVMMDWARRNGVGLRVLRENGHLHLDVFEGVSTMILLTMKRWWREHLIGDRIADAADWLAVGGVEVVYLPT